MKLCPYHLYRYFRRNPDWMTKKIYSIHSYCLYHRIVHDSGKRFASVCVCVIEGGGIKRKLGRNLATRGGQKIISFLRCDLEASQRKDLPQVGKILNQESKRAYPPLFCALLAVFVGSSILSLWFRVVKWKNRVLFYFLLLFGHTEFCDLRHPVEFFTKFPLKKFQVLCTFQKKKRSFWHKSW